MTVLLESKHNEELAQRTIALHQAVCLADFVKGKGLGMPDNVEALHDYPCGVWSQGSHGTWQLGDVVFRPEAMLSTNDYARLRSRALSGDLVTELPPFLAASAIREGRLLTLLPEHPLPEQQINLLYPSHRHPSAIVRAYLDFAQGYVGFLTDVSSTNQ